MLIVIGVILVLLFGLGVFINVATDAEVAGGIIMMFSCALFIVLITAMIFVGVGIQNVKLTDEKIAVCQERMDSEITEMNAIIQSYTKYEKETYTELKPDELTAAINVYPDLKANTMYVEHWQIYKENFDEIKEYKMDRIKLPILKWWLYFGS